MTKPSPPPRTSSPARHKAGKPFFCWWNGTRMHFRTHVKAEHTASPGRTNTPTAWSSTTCTSANCSSCIDDLGIADNTIVQYSTDNGPHYNTWPDAGTTPFRSEKNSNWEGAYRVPCFVKWPGHFPAGDDRSTASSRTKTGCPPSPPPLATPDIKEKLLKGVELNGRTYKNHIDGYNLTRLPQRQGEGVAAQRVHLCERRRRQIVAIRVRRLEGRLPGKPRPSAFEVWREPFIELRVPLLFNLRRDPFEKAQHNSNTYNDWLIDRAFVLGPMQMVASKFLMTMKEFPPSQTPGDWSLESLEKQIKSMAPSTR